MLDGKRILGVIPARGGSKRVLFKNITMFRGKPLILWAIEHAEGSAYIDHFIVSTEDEAIERWAGKRLLKRPAFLAEDHVSSEAVMVHALYSLPGYDFAVLIQPTSPLRISEDIDNCLEIAVRRHNEGGLTGCVSYYTSFRNGAVYVCNVEHFLQRLSFDAAHHYEMPGDRSLDIDHLWQFQQ